MAPESRIDRYVPEEKIGSCGPVETFRVRVQTGQELVLKVLFADRVDKDLAGPLTTSFLAAGRRSEKCPVATIAQIYEVSDDPEAPFVARQWAQGSSLDEIAQLGRKGGGPGGLDPIAAGLICADIAATLEAARTAPTPLFHLGLTPTNVIVSATGQTTVLDFGMAASFRWTSASAGKLSHYIAPELPSIKTVEVPAGPAHKADAFSLGALLYLLLTGTPPPAQVAPWPGLERRLRQPLPQESHLPEFLVSAVRALTAADPQARPAMDKSLRDQLSSGIVSESERLHYLAQALTTSATSAPSRAPSRPTQRPQVSLKKSPAVALRGQRRTRSATGTVATLALCAAVAIAYYKVRITGHPDHSDHSAASNSASLPIERAVKAAVPVMPPAPKAAPASPEIDDTPTRIPGRLYLSTTPDQADVWADGVFRGRTPVDVPLGAGGHRVVVIRPGYLMLRAVFDTTRGEYARRTLQRVGFVPVGDGMLDIQCQSADKYPILIDDEETGLLCPASRVRVPSGKHTIGVFIPPPGKSRAVEVEVPAGLKPKLVTLGD